jgi:tricorn protease-like protein
VAIQTEETCFIEVRDLNDNARVISSTASIEQQQQQQIGEICWSDNSKHLLYTTINAVYERADAIHVFDIVTCRVRRLLDVEATSGKSLELTSTRDWRYVVATTRIDSSSFMAISIIDSDELSKENVFK